MPNPFEVAKLAKLAGESPKALEIGEDCSQVLLQDSGAKIAEIMLREAEASLKKGSRNLSPAGAKFAEAALSTGDDVIIRGAADFYKLSPADREILTASDFIDLTKQLVERSPDSIARARDTLGTVSGLRPLSTPALTLKEELGFKYREPAIARSEY